MRRSLLLAAALLFVSGTTLLAAENATVTVGSIPLMEGPSFIAEEVTGLVMTKGLRVMAVSRTSFMDNLAAIPSDYWYLVLISESRPPVTGYVHGSALLVDPGVAVPVFDPPGFAPSPKVVSGRYAVTSSISERCMKTEGALVVPAGKTATHFTIARLDSSFTSCPGTTYGSIIGFSIVSAADPNREFFSYEEHIADDPAGLQYQKDGFYYLDLDPGAYIVTIRGGPGTGVEITYELLGPR